MDDNKKIFYKGIIVGIFIFIWVAIIGKESYCLFNRFIKKEIPVNDKLKMITKIVNKEYIGEYNKKELEDTMFIGMLYGIGDPYTSYMTSNDFKNFTISTEGRYSGIGAVVMAAKDGGIIIVNPYEGSPAKKAGLLPGDRIIKIDNVDIRQMSMEESVNLMQGEEGTYVNLKIYRESTNKYFDENILRHNVDIPTVSYELLENNIGLIRISAFERVTLEQFKKAYEELSRKNMDRLIIDLRNNPGGLLVTVVEIARMIVPKGVIVYTEDKKGRREFYNSEGNGIDIPLVLLVNENSASASEVLSGAVQDSGVGVLVGEKTFGKALVQDIFPLPDGSAVKLTIAKYYTPKGKSINKKGIMPNYHVPMDEELAFKASTLSIDEDIQLQKAVEVIKNK